MQDYLDTYSQSELANKAGVERHTVARDTKKYIPVRIRTYTTKNNKEGYGIKYLDREEVAEYLKTHRNSCKKKK